MTRRKAKLAATGCILLTFWAFLSAIYTAWLTATPGTPEQLVWRKQQFYFWAVLFCLGIPMSIWMTVRAFKRR